MTVPKGAGQALTRTEANVVRVFAIWTVWVWGTRIGNVLGDDSRSFAFKAVHVTLAIVSVVLAAAAWLVVRRARARALRDDR